MENAPPLSAKQQSQDQAEETATVIQIVEENAKLRVRLEEAEKALRAIRSGRAHALADDITTRKSAEELQRHHQDTFYQLVQNNPFGVYVVDADFRLREVSLGAQKVFSNVRPLLGRDFAEVLHAIWPEPFASEAIGRFRSTLETGEPYSAPPTVERRRDIGEVESYDWRIERIALPEGRPGVICYFYDLSERQRWEAALSESEERYRATFASAPVGIAQVALDGRWLSFNDAVCTITGYPREKLVTLTFADITHPADIAADLAQVESLLAGETSTYSMEKRYVREDRSFVWVNLTVSVLRDAEGKPVNFISVIEDITARKAAWSEWEKLLQMIEASTDFIAMADLEGRLTYMNAGARNMIGLGLEEDAGVLRFTDYVPERWQDFFHDTVLPTVREHGYWEGELQLRNLKTGVLVDVFRNTFLIRDPQSGEPACYATVTRNITAQKRTLAALEKARQDAEAANEEKDAFLSKLSHELRTPLTPVLMVTSALLNEEITDPMLREDLEMILRNVELEVRLIDDLLDVTRITHGKLVLEERLCDLHEIVRHALTVCDDALKKRGIEVAVTLDAPMAIVTGDPTRLQQVFWNLLNNAAKFAPDAGRVEIRTTLRGGDQLQINVSDNGIGIESAQLAALFDAFEQGGKAVTQQFGGLGLGLAICRGVVHLHGGRIWAESDGPGKGATFVVELPVAKVAP